MAAKKSRTEESEGSKHNLEHDIQRLEKIVETLEQGEAPLEKALALYEEGIQLSKTCTEKLQKAELRIKSLTKNNDGKLKLENFE